MDYKKLYNNIINNRLNNDYDGYTEKHHILPRSLGGSDDKSNIVKLSAREHFICHYLLMKIYINTEHKYKMIKAFMFMNSSSKLNGERYMNSRLFEKQRILFSEAMKVTQNGDNNSQYGTMWIYNPILETSKKVPKTAHIPKGWKKGRIVSSAKKKCAYCGNILPLKSTSKFCNNKCKTYYKSPAYKIIDDNIDEILESIKNNKSIDKTLKSFGITGKRVGNSYVSKIAKSRGIEILKRRNSLD